ncbi:hypothetical protein OH76DRAFT_871962 [Lentinus brumalis]|uniref:Uncharacterized protein n=1 Tax=Lentinus brumalis TaxID=2498619 RepID=A0A371DRJ0_9APHY|nr:hypothetical protein OH76DRAFT_871962 [Polyporus brumalis]
MSALRCTTRINIRTTVMQLYWLEVPCEMRVLGRTQRRSSDLPTAVILSNIHSTVASIPWSCSQGPVPIAQPLRTAPTLPAAEALNHTKVDLVLRSAPEAWYRCDASSAKHDLLGTRRTVWVDIGLPLAACILYADTPTMRNASNTQGIGCLRSRCENECSAIGWPP